MFWTNRSGFLCLFFIKEKIYLFNNIIISSISFHVSMKRLSRFQSMYLSCQCDKEERGIRSRVNISVTFSRRSLWSSHLIWSKNEIRIEEIFVILHAHFSFLWIYKVCKIIFQSNKSNNWNLVFLKFIKILKILHY